ncbi:MAG TPA: tetratricopeptide repeat protein [Blastocatellia bacterium]|nr:tetratricopeptide repeat protein [Blastocatellia bacterium]
MAGRRLLSCSVGASLLVVAGFTQFVCFGHQTDAFTAKSVRAFAGASSRPQAETYKERGDAFIKSKQYDEAVAAFKEAIRLRPDYPEAYYQLGWVHAETKKYTEALTALREAVRLKGDYAEAHHNLGVSSKAPTRARRGRSMSVREASFDA